MKKKTLFSVLALCVASLFLLAACGGGTASSTAPAASGSEAAPATSGSEGAATGEETTLTMWSWSPIPRTAEKMIAAFEEENPGITIDYTNYNYNPEYLAALSAAAASDSLPDIIGLQPGSLTQQYRDYLVDIGSYATESWGDDWMSKFNPVSANQIQAGNPEGDDGSYILPIESQVIYIVYNTAVFEEQGLEKPTTYAELQEVCNALTEAGIAPFWLGGADGWQHVNLYLMVLSQIDTEIFDKAQAGEVSWTEPEFVQAMSNYQRMFDDGIFQQGAMSNTAYPQGVQALQSGTAGMVALGSWWFQEYTAPEDERTDAVANWTFDSFYLPAIEDGLNDSAPIGGTDFGYGITKNCANPDAAWTALESFASGAGIQACVDDLNNLAAYNGITPQDPEIPENITAQLTGINEELQTAMNQRIGEPTIEQAVQDACAAIATGEMTPEEAMASVQAAQDALGTGGSASTSGADSAAGSEASSAAASSEASSVASSSVAA